MFVKHVKVHGHEIHYKIKYEACLLPSMSQDSGSLIDAIANSEELEIFKTKLVKDVINYKWDRFAHT